MFSTTLAAELRQRLQSTGGRPTDPSRSLLRLVRFSPEHWKQLETLATAWSTDSRKISAAQVAALLIEHGLTQISSADPQ